jgi:glycosyltransferase involved in cell wall biosynthesis
LVITLNWFNKGGSKIGFMQVPLILVSNRIKLDDKNSASGLNGSTPRQDYLEIARCLHGELAGYTMSDQAWYHLVRQIEQYLKIDLVEAAHAINQVTSYNLMLSTSEKMAIPLALFLSLSRYNIPHVVIAHKLSSGLKTGLWENRIVYQRFSHIICLCKAQANYAIQQLGFPSTKVDFIYDKVDQRFFSPQPVDTEDYILAVGQEQRDYQTLLKAIEGTNLRLIVVASSPWSTSKIQIKDMGKVTIVSHIPYTELRMLYAKARLVVVPLFDVDYAAGVNALLEAMAMAKPLIVTQTRGITDYVVDNETAVFVPPGDPHALQNALLSLWDRVSELGRLGANARQIVEECMNLDIYVNQVVEIVSRFIG